jgi:hypothetical protein
MRGENFPGRLIGSRKPIGFYVTRFVEAQSVEDAESLALQALQRERSLRVPPVVRKRFADARVYFEEIVEVEPRWKRPKKGFSFFEMGT